MISKTLGTAAAALLVVGLSTPALFAQDSAEPAAEEAAEVEAAAELEPRTVWDGVYTAAQSERGKEVYSLKCGNCHNGGFHAPALNNGKFRSKYDEMTLDGLYAYIRDYMPAGNGRSLTDQQYADVLANLLERNKMPAGDVELPIGEDALATITFLAKKPE